MTAKLRDVALLLYELFDLPVYHLAPDGRLAALAGSLLLRSQSGDAAEHSLPHPPEVADQLSLIATAPGGERWICVSTSDKPTVSDSVTAAAHGWLAIGPFLAESSEQPSACARSGQAALTSPAPSWGTETDTLPILALDRQLQIARTCHFMLHGVLLEASAILADMPANTSDGQAVDVSDSAKKINPRQLQHELHHDWEYERQLLRYIAEGRSEQLAALVKEPDFFARVGLLSKKSELQNQKYLAITAVTLATRYAMEGGLPSETAYHLSDVYIQKLDELHRSREVDAMLKRALIEFAEQVRAFHLKDCSMTVKRLVNYLQNHIYDPLDLDKLAVLSGYTADYLTRRFKLELGQTVHDYATALKIREAQSLILYSPMRLSEISHRLHFCDQSHFTKVFKKHVGCTPKQYELAGGSPRRPRPDAKEPG